MRLFSRTGAAAVTHDGVPYKAGDGGAFDFPEDLGLRLHRFHSAGRPMWETAIEQQARLMAEEAERRKDPATLLSAVEQLVAQAAQQAPAPKAEPEPAAAVKTPAKTPAKAAAAPASA